MANPIYITPQSNYSNGGRFSSLYFDAVHSFVPTFASRMTKYTISDKSQITNHIVKENVTITMSATITATPINKYENNLVGYTDFKSRPSDAYDLIYSWWNNSVDLFIDEGDRQFTNMQITNIVPIEEGYDARKFDITFEKARRVKYDIVTITGLLANPAEDKAIDGDGGSSTTGKKSEERTNQMAEALRDAASAASDLGINVDAFNTLLGWDTGQ